MKRYTLAIPNELWSALQAIANHRGDPVSSVLRSALRWYVEHEGPVTISVPTLKGTVTLSVPADGGPEDAG